MRRWLDIALVVALLGLGALVSAHLRQRQADAIATGKADAFPPDVPIVTQPDAYLWLRYADEHRSGRYAARDTMRRPPDSPRRPSSVPLLSRLLAFVSRFSGGDLYAAGNALATVLPGLFAIPLAAIGLMLRRPATGLLGGLVGAVSATYFVRTDIGSVDTDLLNLFFPMVAAALLLAADRARTARGRLVAVLALGLTMRLFYLWYAKAGFAVAFGLLLAIPLVTAQLGAARTALHLLLYAASVGHHVLLEAPRSLALFVEGYFTRDDAVRRTVTELAPATPDHVLTTVFSSEALTAVGIVGFCAFAVRHHRAALYLSPVAALAALTPIAGHRFAMYLGPLVGMGLGFVIDASLRRAAQPRAAALLGSIAVFMAAVRLTPAGMTPDGPYIGPATHRALLEVRRHTEDDALILSWWDYGYAIQHVAGRATVLDGGNPGLPRTARVATALTGHDPAELARVLDELGDGRPSYVLLTADLARKYPALATVGGRSGRRDARSVFYRMYFEGEDPPRFEEVLHVPGVARLWRLNRP